MISINLLPPEYQEKQEVKSPFPTDKILAALGILGVVLWIFFIWRASSIRKALVVVDQEYQSLQGEFKSAQVLIAEMNMEILPKKKMIEDMGQPQSQWDRILNLISDTAPDGTWLNFAELDTTIGSFSLAIEGYAKPMSSATPTAQVGLFAGALKKGLEGILSEPSTQSKVSLELETETSAEDQNQWVPPGSSAGGLNLTKFSISFKKKPEPKLPMMPYGAGNQPPRVAQS